MNPNDATILITWAWARACLGEPEPALAAAREAMRLDPWIHWYPARIEFLARHYAEALAHLDATVKHEGHAGRHGAQRHSRISAASTKHGPRVNGSCS